MYIRIQAAITIIMNCPLFFIYSMRMKPTVCKMLPENSSPKWSTNVTVYTIQVPIVFLWTWNWWRLPKILPVIPWPNPASNASWKPRQQSWAVRISWLKAILRSIHSFGTWINTSMYLYIPLKKRPRQASPTSHTPPVKTLFRAWLRITTISRTCLPIPIVFLSTIPISPRITFMWL